MEEQSFQDLIAKMSVSETDSGVIMPSTMNVLLLGYSKTKYLLKFFSFNNFPISERCSARGYHCR